MKHQGNRRRLRDLIEEKCLKTGTEFTLSNGESSSFYFDCKAATLDGECLDLITEEVLAEIDRLPTKPIAIGGLTLGADPIVGAVIVRARQVGHPTVNGSLVRKERKPHGTKNKIENQLSPGTTIVVVDDVITKGGSIKEACDELLHAEYKIVGIVAVIDRKAGGKERLEREYGVPVYTLFERDDFPALAEQASNDKAKVIA
jgi:orotate phosphoribosyltransferase